MLLFCSSSVFTFQKGSQSTYTIVLRRSPPPPPSRTAYSTPSLSSLLLFCLLFSHPSQVALLFVECRKHTAAVGFCPCSSLCLLCSYPISVWLSVLLWIFTQAVLWKETFPGLKLQPPETQHFLSPTYFFASFLYLLYYNASPFRVGIFCLISKT